METLDRYWGAITAFLTQSWFSIGQTEVTPERIFGLVVLLLLSWWGALAVERGIQHVSRSRAGKSMSEPGVYALGRIVRYLIWILGSIIGLNFIGFDLGSLALMGGAIGVGIGGLRSPGRVTARRTCQSACPPARPCAGTRCSSGGRRLSLQPRSAAAGLLRHR